MTTLVAKLWTHGVMDQVIVAGIAYGLALLA